MVYGNDAQKKKSSPRSLPAKYNFAIGYPEPEAGTDLAADRRVVRDEYIVNGQKIWTTGGHDADYVWLACRTDPEALKAQRHFDSHHRHRRSRIPWTPIILVRRCATHQRHLLQRRPGAG